MLRRLRAVRASKRLLREELSRHAVSLRPGVWLLLRPRLARHWRHGRFPAHLRATSLRPTSTKGTRAVLALMAKGWLVPPVLVRVPPDRRGGGAPATAAGDLERYPILMLTGGDVTALADADAGRVLRLFRHTPAPTEPLELRARIAAHVSTPSFEVAPDRRSIREQLVDGGLLTALGPSARVDVVRVLLRRYASLCAEEAAGSSRPFFEAALAGAASASLSTDLRRALARERDALLERAAHWPMTPAHGDMHFHNVVVRDRDAEPFLIDFDHAGRLPFFEDPLALLIVEAYWGRHDLVRAYADGALDPELRALWEAAGGRFDNDDRSRYLLASVLANAHHRSTRGGSRDAAVFVDNVESRWAALRGLPLV